MIERLAPNPVVSSLSPGAKFSQYQLVYRIYVVVILRNTDELSSMLSHINYSVIQENLPRLSCVSLQRLSSQLQRGNCYPVQLPAISNRHRIARCLVSHSPQHDEEHYICWKLQMIERSACSLVENAATLRTGESAVAERGFPGQLGGSERLAMRAVHRYSLSARCDYVQG
jgi:hypothetical protein